MGKKNKTILVCDDDRDFVEVVSVLLKEKGYDVVAAYNGEECLGSVQEDQPDLILLDVMMATTTDGFNVSRELRNSEQTKAIPIIMITAVNETVPYKFEPDDTWLPVDTFIEKPVEPERLLAEIRQKLGT